LLTLRGFVTALVLHVNDALRSKPGSNCQCLRTLVAELNSPKNRYSGQHDNACGHDWNKRTGGRYDDHEQVLGRTCMSATDKDGYPSSGSNRATIAPKQTSNTSSIVRLLSPFVGRVVIANPNLVRAIAWAKVKTDISSSGIHTSGRNPLAWSFASTAASIYITIQLPKVELKNGLTLVREVRVRRPV
jgi:hypothetical protein